MTAGLGARKAANTRHAAATSRASVAAESALRCRWGTAMNATAETMPPASTSAMGAKMPGPPSGSVPV